jgi:site-specific DNA recombinase
MENVTVIKAKNVCEQINQTINVAAYCRISTESEVQDSSLQMQISYYKSYIKNHNDWNFAGIFADIASGLSEDRTEFQKMLKKCRAGKIDLIITKSISHFSRRVLDTLKILQRLADQNVAVYFEMENINSLDDKTQLCILLYSIQAQEESVAKGRNIQFGIQESFKSGNSGFNTIGCYGYKRNTGGKLCVCEEQAAVVRLIYDLYLDGNSLYGITNHLTDSGFLTSKGKYKWSTAQVDAILKNRK